MRSISPQRLNNKLKITGLKYIFATQNSILKLNIDLQLNHYFYNGKFINKIIPPKEDKGVNTSPEITHYNSKEKLTIKNSKFNIKTIIQKNQYYKKQKIDLILRRKNKMSLVSFNSIDYNNSNDSYNQYGGSKRSLLKSSFQKQQIGRAHV